MFSRQLYATTISFTLRRPVLSHAHTSTPLKLTLTRGYARSRFPERSPGVGRSRDRPEKLFNRDTRPAQDSNAPQPEQEYGNFWSSSFTGKSEGQPSVEQSPLWKASQRPPASNPEEGLKRLLLDNDLLVITRCVFEFLHKYMHSGLVLINPATDKSRC